MKFKAGDWILDDIGNSGKIIQVTNGDYFVEVNFEGSIKGERHLIGSQVDKYCKLDEYKMNEMTIKAALGLTED